MSERPDKVVKVSNSTPQTKKVKRVLALVLCLVRRNSFIFTCYFFTAAQVLKRDTDTVHVVVNKLASYR